MEIRKARLKDVDGITELWKRMISYHRRYETSKFEKLKPGADRTLRKFVIGNIRGRNGLVLVAEDRGKLVGYCMSFIKKNVPIFRIERTGYISDLYIREKYRGSGIASQFKKHTFRWFKKKGITHASIEVYFENKASWNIYRKWGFGENHVRLISKI